MKALHAAMTDSSSAVDAGSAGVDLAAALARMHARDRERVASGEIQQSDLFLIPANMARRSTALWTAQATFRFKR